MSERLGAAPADDARIVIAVSDPARAEQLVDALSSNGYDTACAPGITRVADFVDEELSCVVIVDDDHPNWLRSVTDLLHLRPNARLLALVDVESPAEMLAAVGAGVAGFVSPLADDAAIARTVRALIDSGVAIPRGLVPALVEEVRRGRGRSVTTATGQIDVTEREWEILQLLLQRRSTREISEMLFVSVGTVRSHISALGRKLGAVDREDTIRLLEQRRG